jgi:hypothetical protein
MRCHHCGFEVEVKEKIGRQEPCPKCGSYLHCCLNCRFYDEAAYHQCREPEAEWVSDKASANFCDYFEPGDSGKTKSSSKADEARKKLDDLFKKSD